MAEKISTQVTLVGEYSFATQFGTTHIYKMKDTDGKVYVWKTSSYMMLEVVGEYHCVESYFVRKGDVVNITASVKGENEYKGETQTMLTRLKVVSVVKRFPTKYEIQMAKKKAQMESLAEGDRLWEMPYRQYKMHYADCETLAGSFKTIEQGSDAGSYITVILRAGRLKASGVRGEHYSGYCCENELGEKVTYRAVNEENAIKRANKEFPDHKWEVVKIYRYK